MFALLRGTEHGGLISLQGEISDSRSILLRAFDFGGNILGGDGCQACGLKPKQFRPPSHRMCLASYLGGGFTASSFQTTTKPR